jgi:hypothetical protein
MADHIPTVRQRRLAQALRELRHDAGLTQDAVVARMGWHTSKLFRMENARSPRVDWLDVKELMAMYGVPSPHREALIQLARDVVLNEAVLRRLVGGARAMVAQLRALAKPPSARG